MASLQPLEPPPPTPANGGVASISAAPVEIPPVPIAGSKRQRRPSVRLGEIGDQPAASDLHLRRPKTRPAHQHHNPHSKTRHLTTLAAAAAFNDPHPADDGTLVLAAAADNEENLDSPLPAAPGARRAPPARDGRPWRAARRMRSGWASSKLDEGVDSGDLKWSGGEDDGDDGFREDSGSPSDRNERRGQSATRFRVLERRDADPASEGDPPSETNGGGDWNERNGDWRSGGEDDGVRSWLNNLGLGRYVPVFEIHEVDEEVLPFLTLEDLKDMGINAVGSRRKIFCAIQKLRKSLN